MVGRVGGHIARYSWSAISDWAWYRTLDGVLHQVVYTMPPISNWTERSLMLYQYRNKVLSYIYYPTSFFINEHSVWVVMRSPVTQGVKVWTQWIWKKKICYRISGWTLLSKSECQFLSDTAPPPHESPFIIQRCSICTAENFLKITNISSDFDLNLNFLSNCVVGA
jgi:hypothetical protein